MSKLIYKTKKPRKGYVGYESFSTHVSNNYMDVPKEEVEKEALKIVQETMDELIKKLVSLGYDETKVIFSIQYL